MDNPGSCAGGSSRRYRSPAGTAEGIGPARAHGGAAWRGLLGPLLGGVEGSLGSSVTEARQHHSELRRTAPPAADSRNSVRCEGGDPAGCCCSQLHISAGPN